MSGEVGAKAILRQGGDNIVRARSGVPDGVGLTIQVGVALDGAYPPARQVFAEAVQCYATKLADASAYQEAVNRAIGAKGPEVTESTVIRARETLERPHAVSKSTSAQEALFLVGSTISSSATGVIGGYLHSPQQWAIFAILATTSVILLLYCVKIRVS